MIRAVIFDIDNTMYNFDRAHAAAMEALFRYGNQALSLEPGSMKEGLSAAQKLILDRLGTNSSAIHNRLIRFQTFLESMKKRRSDQSAGDVSYILGYTSGCDGAGTGA